MTDREKVIQGLEHCGQPMECDGCPYDTEVGNCFTNLKTDALELLKKDDQQRGIKWGPPIRIEMGDIEFPEIKYCPWCGRMVKWGGEAG